MNENNIKCKDCGRVVSVSEFAFIDDEFNEVNPKCPNCQKKYKISLNTCEYCEKPAVHEVGDLYLCEECCEENFKIKED
jgi:Zn finger protein HypA/HybF involved in hydrogenase expression